jgi:serine/threonine-protein kinase
MGAVMYELLSGGPPFPAASVPEICAAILDSEAAPLPPSCPPALGAVVMRCLDKERERRFQTVAELASALLPFAPGEARAYASRSSCILRASALQLEPIATGGPRPVARSARFQSSALVAAATVLALSALGIAITVSKTSEPASATASPAPVRAPALVALDDAPPAATTAHRAAAAEPTPEPGTSPVPGAGGAAELAAPTAPPQRPVRPAVAPKPRVARSVLRSPAPSSNADRPVESTRAPSAELDASRHVGRPRLVEPRSRVRLVERVEAPARPGWVAVDAVAPKPSTGGVRKGVRQ